MKQLSVQKLKPQALLPTRATAGSAGYDLYACIEAAITIPVGGVVRIGTGIAIGIEDPTIAAFVYARSGLATKQGLIPANCVGVIDSDYRGEILVALKNLSDMPQRIAPNDRIAQLVLAPVYLPTLLEVETLSDTARGDGGFGSTGVKGV